MSKVIAVANQKGGVAKSTTCINLSASLVATKRKVLLIDLDPQGNATMGSGIDKNKLERSVKDVLLNDIPIDQTIMITSARYSIIPANRDLTAAEVRLLKVDQREYYLRVALAPIRADYDFIFLDCPPSLNMLTVNALVAADSVLIPMQCEYYALEGLTSLLSTVEQIRKTVNPPLHLEGLLRTMYDGRNRLAQEVSEQLFHYFGEKVYNTIIPRNVRLAEAPSHGLPALLYDKHCQGAATYLALAGEMLRREEGIQQQTLHEVCDDNR